MASNSWTLKSSKRRGLTLTAAESPISISLLSLDLRTKIFTLPSLNAISSFKNGGIFGATFLRMVYRPSDGSPPNKPPTEPAIKTLPLTPNGEARIPLIGSGNLETSILVRKVRPSSSNNECAKSSSVKPPKTSS